jgi:hypothetical protein
MPTCLSRSSFAAMACLDFYRLQNYHGPIDVFSGSGTQQSQRRLFLLLSNILFRYRKYPSWVPYPYVFLYNLWFMYSTFNQVRSSLELASKNIVCGSINMVYALFYTLCLGFSIQMGSDFYLIFDGTARRDLAEKLASMETNIDLSGTFNVSGGDVTGTGLNTHGSFTYIHNTPWVQTHMVEGCFRPPTHPWFLRTFPAYTQYPIIPLFSILSSFANMQPWRSRELVVMVVISCISYTANKVANHYIFNRSDIVSRYRCVCCWSAGQRVLQENGWHCVYVYGHGSIVPRSVGPFSGGWYDGWKLD